MEQTFVYDANGNITSFDGQTFAYDSSNNQMTSDSTNIYSYDAYGRCYRKIENSVATYYFHSGDNVRAEYNNDDDLEAEYFYSGNWLIAIYTGDFGYDFVYQDHLGNVAVKK